jgi:guanosine-3',5'-bis(diphosphate) 3'-pyrophosphohydrolase
MKRSTSKKFFSERMHDALTFASHAHMKQMRKTSPDIPYISHPVGVGFMLQKAGFPEDVVVAGILHDVVEDCAVRPSEIKQRFGSRVARLVEAVTEDKSLPWEECKVLYKKRALRSGSSVCAIVAADKLWNAKDMMYAAQNGKNIWGKFTKGKRITIDNQIEFAHALHKKWPHPLSKEFLDAAEDLKKL